MTIDQAQQLREACLEVRDRLGIPEGHFALEVLLDLPDAPAVVVPADVDIVRQQLASLSMRMPL
jgi:hypothetical protein